MLYNRAVPTNLGRLKSIILPLFLLFFTAGILTGEPASWMTGKSNPEELQIQLVTIEPGDELYTWWGHSAIIVTDTATGESRFYNYGLFSFETENFFSNFAMGRLWFEVGAMPTQFALEAYKRRNRTITIQTLNATPEVKQELARFLETNILPENRKYLYDHYYDNCATRVRDILDTAADGELHTYADAPAETTFRRITRRFSGGYFFADMLLMFLMGQTIDETITIWETMFLPTELQGIIEEISIQTAEGRTEPFVVDSVVFNQATGRKPIPDKASSAVPLALAFGGGMGLIISLFSFALRHKPAAARIHFGIASCLTGFFMGLPGIVLALMSLFTNHSVTYWNENLALANPLTFLAFPLGIFTAAGFQRISRIAAWLWFSLAGIGALYIILKVFPFFTQDNWQIIAFLAPLLAALAYSGRQQLTLK